MASKDRGHSLGQDKTGSKPLQLPTSSSHWGALVAAGIIIIAGLLAYHNSFGGPFIFDDEPSIIKNPTIRRLWNAKEVLSPPAKGQAVQRRPIVNLSLAINYAIGRLDVKGYHTFNVGMHVLAALTLFGVVRRTLKIAVVPQGLRGQSTSLSLVIALIWVVHPLHTDAVTYIIQRTEVLAGLFYLLTLYCVIRGSIPPGSVCWYTAAVIACLLGMGSKESMVSAPLMVLLYDRVFLSRSFKEVFRRRWALYVGLAATWGLVAVYIPHGSEGTAVFGKGSASLAYALTQFEAICNYLRLCFWPAPLILDYGSYKPTSFWEALPYATLITLLLAGMALALRHSAWLSFLGVWFFAILAPSSSFIPVLAQASAEKRMYLPLAAVISIVVVCGYTFGRHFLAWLVSSDRQRSILGKLIGYALVAAVLIVLGLLTVRRNDDYASELSIWDVTVRQRPDNDRAYNNRGFAYNNSGEYDQAIRDFDQAIVLRPAYATAYNNRGFAYLSKGEYDQAIRDLDKAIEVNRGFAKAYNNRGVAYFSKGEYDRAIRDLDQAIELSPKHAMAYNNRGIAYAGKGNREQAIRDFDQAIVLRPAYTKAYHNRGIAYFDKGDYEGALRDFDQAIKLNTRFARAYYNRGRAYSAKGNYEGAIRDFDQAIALDPAYSQAYMDRGVAYSAKSDYERAVRDYNKVIKLDPDSAWVCNNLAWILATCPEPRIRDGAEAVRLAERGCGLTDNRAPELLDTLAAAYAELGQFDRAVKTAEKAIQLVLAPGKEKLAKDIESRLKLYKAKRPFRTSAR